MIIIGAHNAEDSSLCLIRDGELKWAIGEERLRREKLFQGLPELALAHVLEQEGISVKDVDYFVFGWNAHKQDYPAYVVRLLSRIAAEEARGKHSAALLHERFSAEFSRDLPLREAFGKWMSTLGVPPEKVIYYDHHQTHAWSAFSTSPFDVALVFTLDARGDWKSGSVSVADTDTGITELCHNFPFDSLGFLYGQVTEYLGYRPHRHEGKVTGLAAHGEAGRTIEIFRKCIEFDGNGGFRSNLGYYRPFFTNQSNEFVADLSDHSREDIAAGLQSHCEDLVVQWVQYWLDKERPGQETNICLSGGLFANVLINQRVAELPHVSNIYVSPHMGDGGLSLGAVAHCQFENTRQAKLDMPTVYLGPRYGANEILEALQIHETAIDHEPLEDKVQNIVEDILQDRVIGYFDNRMEWGPRALGARSIIYHTRDASVNDWLNKRLHRTEFMPFAPVTPVEYAADAYNGWREDHKSAELMTRTYHCSPAFIEKHPAAVHIDGTARPQVVNGDLHGDYYRLVKAYCERTGEMALINTSFNQHEEPIVCSPEDAISSLLNDNVDVLYIGDFRVSRKSAG